jgi:hypothetical protein
MYDGPMGIFEDYGEEEPAFSDYAFLEGHDAYFDGGSNPYDEYPNLARAWQDGFRTAQEEERQAYIDGKE